MNDMNKQSLLARRDPFSELPIILKLSDCELLELEDGKEAKKQVKAIKKAAEKRGLKWMTSYHPESREHILQIFS